MASESDLVTVICSSCGARYRAYIDWLESAAKFDCSCGARLEPNTLDFFLTRHKMMDRPVILLRPFSRMGMQTDAQQPD